MAENSNNSNSVTGKVTVEQTETRTESTSMPRAHGVNQMSNTVSESTSGFTPRGNSEVPNNLNNHNNPALGQKRDSSSKTSDLDDNKDKGLDNQKDKDKDDLNNNKNNNDKKENKDNPKDNNTNKNPSMPSADPNNNLNANAANMDAKKNNPKDSNGDNKFNPRKTGENSNSPVSKKRTLSNRLSSLSNKSSENVLANTLNDMWQNPVIRRKIIIGASAVFGVIFAFVIFIALLSSLIVTLSSSMCNDDTFAYSGSGDVAEFMCGMQSPVQNYTVTSNYGYNVDEVHAGRLHSGIDLAVATGTPVYAVQNGKVVATVTSGSVSSGYGNDVVIDHGGGIFTRYAHNSKLLVSKGDFVNKGQQIAEAGSTGHSTGPHGHFEIMKTTVNNLSSGFQDPNPYFLQHNAFMKSCGSSVNATYTSYTPSTVETVSVDSYNKLKTIKKLSSSTGKKKNLSPSSYLNYQSFAYNNGTFYVQGISKGARGKDGYIYKYNSSIKQEKMSPGKQALGHGNGLTYCTSDNRLYSVTTAGIRDNTKATMIDPDTLKVVGTKKLGHGTSSIAYDKLTNRFVTSSGASDQKASSTGYLYVYESDLSTPSGAKKIAKKRWKTPGDIAAYGGIIYVAVSSYYSGAGTNYVDMYNEENGDYLGSFSAPYYEIEGVDIDADGQIVLLFHGASPFLQFTGIKANVISGSDSSSENFDDDSDQCCTDSTPTYTSASGSSYCPNGITVTGDNAGTYSLDEYVERVVTAENGGANEEALKALAIAARTYAINRTKNCEKSIPNSTAAQVMADKASDRVKNALQSVKGSVMLYNGNYFSAEYSSFLGSCSGDTCSSTFVKIPSSEKATFTMPKSYLTINAGHERGLSQNGSNYMASQGKTYQEILEFFYADGIEITGASPSNNSCSLGSSGTYNQGKIWDYSQADYSDAYCGGTIADSGCGPTAMAMVVSTFLNEKHDPPELAKIAKDTGYCSTQTHEYFKSAAKKYNLTYKKLQAGDYEEVLTALNRGDSLVIANVTNVNKVDGYDNFWTPGGHYIVLAGHSGRDVWVQDPNKGMASVQRANTKGDGVYNFDKYIVPAATNGYMIFKKA